MPLYTPLDLAALALAAIHFGVPLAYYWYLKKKWLHRPWDIRQDPNYTPKVTIIIPTYNEAELIEKKLDNIYQQDYPKDKLEVIVVDSASTDGTPEKVAEWAKKHPDLNLKLIQEPERRGKLYAVLNVINHVLDNTDIIVLTDADAFFPPNTLKAIIKYFADKNVGALTASITYLNDNRSIESSYRSLYNKVRVAESKIHSTPVHNGPLQAFRANLIKKIGLPDFPGADDSAFASYIAFAGYRAIQVDDAWVYEPHRGNTIRRKIRRAQHLTLNFLNTKKYAKRRRIYRRTVFEKIWRIEYYLHIVNPWLLPAIAILLATSTLYHSVLAITLLALGIATLTALKTARTWTTQQLYLIAALIKNTWTKAERW